MKPEDKQNFIKVIIEIDQRLRQVEVKGDSVESLLAARMMLKQLASELEKITETREKEE